MDYLKLISQRHFRPVPTAKLYQFPSGVQTVNMVHCQVEKIFQNNTGTFIGDLNSDETLSSKKFSNPNFLNINQSNVDILPPVNTLATYVINTIKNSIPETQNQNSTETKQTINKNNEILDTFYDCENSIYRDDSNSVMESEFEIKHNRNNHNKKIKIKKLKNVRDRLCDLLHCNTNNKNNSRRYNTDLKVKNSKFANKQNILHDIEMDIAMDLSDDSFTNIDEDSSTDEYFTGDSDFENIYIENVKEYSEKNSVCENSNDSTGSKKLRTSPVSNCSLKKSKMYIPNKSPNTNFYRNLIEELTKNYSNKHTKCCCTNIGLKRSEYKNYTNDICKNETSTFNNDEEANNEHYNIIPNHSKMFTYDIIFSEAKCLKPNREIFRNYTNKNPEQNLLKSTISKRILPYDNQKSRLETPYKNINKEVHTKVFQNTKKHDRTSECDNEDSFVFFENDPLENRMQNNNISTSDCESDDSFVVFNETPLLPKVSPLKFRNISRKLKGTLNCSKNLFLNLTLSKLCNRSPLEQESDDSSLFFDDSDSVKSTESQELSTKMLEKLNLEQKGRIRAISDCESEDSYIVFGENENYNENDDIDDDQFDWNDDDVSIDESDDEDCDSEGCDQADCCSVSSESWIKTIKKNTPKKKVQFKSNSQLCIIYPMVQWSHAYQKARKGEWEEAARDRERFKREISKLKDIIDPVISNKHRKKIFQERFENTI